MQSRVQEQHIAVFGGSGSGKTVLLSSFYGATQEPEYLQRRLFNVLADNVGQGQRLYRNYVGMRDSADVPAPTRFAARSYAFTVKMKDGSDSSDAKARPFDALRLVWHDYPGEWFEQEPSGAEEAQRRIDTFKDLLGSDVALLLVDGQRLLDNAGEEERYLKSLFVDFRNGLLRLKDGLLTDGKLVDFPRIWILALSKADLLPGMDVFRFRDLVINKACDEIDDLRNVIGDLVEGRDVLSVGEDFMLLSSARFAPGRIDVTKRIGVELILPVAAILPFERHLHWKKIMQIPGKVAENILAGTEKLAAALVRHKASGLPGPLGALANLVGPDVVSDAIKLVGDQLRKVNSEALTRQENLSATLTGYRMDLDRGESERVLLRSLQ